MSYTHFGGNNQTTSDNQNSATSNNPYASASTSLPNIKNSEETSKDQTLPQGYNDPSKAENLTMLGTANNQAANQTALVSPATATATPNVAQTGAVAANGFYSNHYGTSGYGTSGITSTLDASQSYMANPYAGMTGYSATSAGTGMYGVGSTMAGYGDQTGYAQTGYF